MTPTDYDRTEAESSLSIDARALLLAATLPGGTGVITLVVPPAGLSCTAGGRQFLRDDSPGQVGRWVAAVAELIRAGLARDEGPGEVAIGITAAGFEAAGRLRLGAASPTADTADLARRVRRSAYLARPTGPFAH